MINKFHKFKIPFVYLLIFTSIVTIIFLVSERYARINYPGNFKLNKNITYFNVDNEYYLDPVENYLSGKGWRRNPPVGNGSYYRRTPGYSLLYLFTRVVTPNIETALILIVCIQFVLYLLFFYSFHKTLILIKISPTIYNVSMLLMSVIPYFYHIILGTNTESISVFLIMYFVYFLLAAYKTDMQNKKLLFYIIAALLIGFDTLTRPYLGIFLVLLPIFIFKDYFDKGYKILFRNSIVIGMIPVFMISAWAIRNYTIGNEIVLLEKAYHPESLDRMKPEFRGLAKLATSCCGIDGSTFNSFQIPLYFAALNGDTSMLHVQNAVKKFSPKNVDFFGEEILLKLLRRYQIETFNQKKYFDNNISMPKIYTPEQLAIEDGFDSLITKFKHSNYFDYYVFIPLKYLTQIILHSNTVGIYLMQQEFRKFTFLNILRYISLVIHVSLFFFILISFFTTRKNLLYFILFFIIPIIYLIFFCYFVQSIEQRYYSPILPILILSATYSIDKIYIKFLKR